MSRSPLLLSRPRRGALPVSSAVRPDDPPAAAQIISATVVLMAENGYHGTSVRDIAEAAGVSPAALYHHFGSKHGLLFLVMDRGNDSLFAQSSAALYAAAHDPVERLRALVGVHVSLHLRAQREAFLGNTELRSLEPAARKVVVGKRDQQQRLFDQVVRDGVERGVFTTPFPDEATRALVTMSSAVAGWYRPRGPLSADELTARFQELALSLVGHVPEGPPAPSRGPA